MNFKHQTGGLTAILVLINLRPGQADILEIKGQTNKSFGVRLAEDMVMKPDIKENG